MPEIRTCIGSEQITSTASSAPLAAVPTYAVWAILKPRVAGIYLRLNGGAATSADMLIDAGIPVEVTSGLANVRLLQAAGGAIVDVWYFG